MKNDDMVIKSTDDIDPMDKYRIVWEAIRPWCEKHKVEGFKEVIECPSCWGRLHLSIAKRNGHVRGRCETPECVEWME